VNKQTQIQKILDYADNTADHGVFSMRDIYVKCFINSPTARISDMRKLGYVFDQWWHSDTPAYKDGDSDFLYFQIIGRPCATCTVGGGA
jgi:hypothetical protein